MKRLEYDGCPLTIVGSVEDSIWSKARFIYDASRVTRYSTGGEPVDKVNHTGHVIGEGCAPRCPPTGGLSFTHTM